MKDLKLLPGNVKPKNTGVAKDTYIKMLQLK